MSSELIEFLDGCEPLRRITELLGGWWISFRGQKEVRNARAFLPSSCGYGSPGHSERSNFESSHGAAKSSAV